MKLAVTAASGQLGAAIVNEAIRKLGSQNLIGVARNTEKAAHLGVEVRHGDVFGTIISGIYEGISSGAFEIDSDYRSVTGGNIFLQMNISIGIN